MALEHHDRQKEARGRGKVFVALLIVSASFNIGLAHALGARYARLNPDDVLRQGARMTPIQATSRDGRPITYAFSGSEQPTLLYVFRSNCEWCDVNVRSIRALSDAVAARYHVLGLDVSTIEDRKSTRLNSSHLGISYAVFCLKKKKKLKRRAYKIKKKRKKKTNKTSKYR